MNDRTVHAFFVDSDVKLEPCWEVWHGNATEEGSRRGNETGGCQAAAKTAKVRRKEHTVGTPG